MVTALLFVVVYRYYPYSLQLKETPRGKGKGGELNTQGIIGIVVVVIIVIVVLLLLGVI